MSLSTYTGLVAVIKRRMNRVDLDSYIDDYIALAEARLNRVLRHPTMLSIETALPVSAEFTNLPTDFLEIDSIVMVASGRRWPLTPQSNSTIPRWFNGSSGMPTVFSLRGSQIQVEPVPSPAVTLNLTYYKRLPTIVGGANGGINWLLTDHPDAYLFAALAEAAQDMQDEERLTNYSQRAKAAVDEITNAAAAIRWGTAPAVTSDSTR